MIRFTELVQIGLFIVITLQVGLRIAATSNQATRGTKPDTDENSSGGLCMAWIPQQGYCECVNINGMPFWTVQRPETHGNGQQWPETGRTDHEGPARGQKYPRSTQNGQERAEGARQSAKWLLVAPTRQQITETAGNVKKTNLPTYLGSTQPPS